MLEEINAKLDRLLGVPIKSNYAKWTPEKLSLLEMMYYEGSSVVDIIEVMRTEFGDERNYASIACQIMELESALEIVKDVPIHVALLHYRHNVINKGVTIQKETIIESPNKTFFEEKRQQEDKPIMFYDEPPF